MAEDILTGGEQQQGTQQDQAQVLPGAQLPSLEAAKTPLPVPGGEPAAAGERPAAEAAKEPAPPAFDEKAQKEIRRLHGVLKNLREENLRLREEREAPRGEEARPQRRERQPEPPEEGWGEETAAPDDRVAALEQRLDEMTLFLANAQSRLEARESREAETRENNILLELEKTALGSIQAFCSDLMPQGLSPEERADEQAAIEAFARYEFLMLDPNRDKDDDALLTPENVLAVAQAARDRYKTIGARRAALQMKANEEAKKLNKVAPQGPTGVPPGRTFKDMTPAEIQAAQEEYAKRVLTR